MPRRSSRNPDDRSEDSGVDTAHGDVQMNSEFLSEPAFRPCRGYRDCGRCDVRPNEPPICRD